MASSGNDYYVYLHRRNDTNDVFYIGKGRGYRSRTKDNRNKWWLAIVAKHGYTVEYVEKGLTEYDAYNLEVETIKFYRECGYKLCNLTDGGEGGSGSVRKQPITDGVMIDLNMPVPRGVGSRTTQWKSTRMRRAINTVLANLATGEKIYYSRSGSLRHKVSANRKKISQHYILKAVKELEQLGWIESFRTSVKDSVMIMSSMKATDLLFESLKIERPVLALAA
jgi:hypothetical protein